MTAEVRHTVVDLRGDLRTGAQRAVVMTMGALHDGHAELKDGERLEVSRRRWPELKRTWAA